ncbi:MAG: hypothetical protein CMJ18_10920 [Phycisphaeraceae bacterium]|nr:hypothetical protein [Phycisphaeraceae bacterium]
MRPRLLFLWPEFLDDNSELSRQLASFADFDAPLLSSDELPGAVGDYDILVPRIEHEVDTVVLDAGKRLRMIGTPSTGTDHIAVAEAERRGLQIVCLKHEREFLDTVQTTAELAWLLILSCNRNMRAAMKHVEAGEWESQTLRGHEMYGRTLGIIGYGRLGTMVSRFAHAFRMNVIASDPEVIPDTWVRRVSQEQLLAEADVVTLHVHLTEATRGMIGAEQFAQMKPGAYLVNTSRGGLIDEDALVESLGSGRLAGAGLDVVSGERDEDRTSRPLFRYAAAHDNLIITPHIGGVTREAQPRATLHLAGMLKAAWDGIESN